MENNQQSLPDRRASERKNVKLPVRILTAGGDAGLETETTETIDLSRDGVRIAVDVEFPISIGDRVSISSDDALLQAKLALFEVRWKKYQGTHYLIGAKRIYGQGRWRVMVA